METTEIATQKDIFRLYVENFRAVEDNYTYHVKTFCDFAEASTGTVVETVADYYEALNDSGLSASTIRCRRQAVKRRFRDALTDAEGQVRAQLDFELKRLDARIKCPSAQVGANGAWKVISAAEYQKLMEGARSCKQRRFIETLYATGMRISELTGIKLADCTMQGNVVDIRVMGKGSKERHVYITRAMYSRIVECFHGELFLFETGNGTRYVRPYVSEQIAKLTLAVLGRRLSAHCFRHTFITHKLVETGRPKAVSQYVGHADVGITLRIYGHDSFSPADVLGPEAVA